MHDEDSTPVPKPSKTKRLLKKAGPALLWTGAFALPIGYMVGIGVYQWKLSSMALETAKIEHAAALLKQS